MDGWNQHSSAAGWGQSSAAAVRDHIWSKHHQQILRLYISPFPMKRLLFGDVTFNHTHTHTHLVLSLRTIFFQLGVGGGGGASAGQFRT